jgi:hypothetical protein
VDAEKDWKTLSSSEIHSLSYDPAFPLSVRKAQIQLEELQNNLPLRGNPYKGCRVFPDIQFRKKMAVYNAVMGLVCVIHVK